MVFFHWCWSCDTVTPIISQHVSKYNTAAANVILCVIFSFRKSQSDFAHLLERKPNIITPMTRASQTRFIFHVPEGRPAWDLKDKLHICIAVPQLTLFPSLLGKSLHKWSKKSTGHIFHCSKTSATARLLLHTWNSITVSTSARNSLVLAQIPLGQRRQNDPRTCLSAGCSCEKEDFI